MAATTRSKSMIWLPTCSAPLIAVDNPCQNTCNAMKQSQLGILLLILAVGCGDERPSVEYGPDLGDQIHFVVRTYPQGEGSLKNERSVNPSLEDIATAIDVIDWPNVDGWTGLELLRSGPHFMTIKVEGTRSEQVEMGFSERPPSSEKWIHGFASRVPLEDAKQALNAFLQNDQSFRTLVPWEFD